MQQSFLKIVFLTSVVVSTTSHAFPEQPSVISTSTSKPIFANYRGVYGSHSGKDMSRMHVAFPDVDKTPQSSGPIPIPYPVFGIDSDKSTGSKKVKPGETTPRNKPNQPKHHGFQAKKDPTEPDIAPARNTGKAYYAPWSMDVKHEGKNVSRIGDPLFHRKKNILP